MTNEQLAYQLRLINVRLLTSLSQEQVTALELAAQRLEASEVTEAGIERGAIDLAGGPWSWEQLDQVARENFRFRFREALQAAREA